MSSVSIRQFGFIKWFGGFNNKTGRDNNFGFVALSDGTELYLHRNDWHGSTLPTTMQPVTFFAETRGDRVCCRRAGPLRGSNCALAEIYEALLALPTTPVMTSPDSIRGCADLRVALTDEFHDALHASSKQDIQALCAANIATRSPFGLVSRGAHETTDYELLLDATDTAVTADDVWDHLPRQLITKYEPQIAAQLASLAPDVIRSKVMPVLEVLPVPLVITLLTREGFADSEILDSLSSQIDRYLCAVILGGEAVPDYFIELAGDPRDWNWVCNNPLLQERLDRYHFKKSLAARGTEFLAIYARTPVLAGDLEYFILYEIFSLIVAGNAREVVYKVFLQRLWAALINKQVDLRMQHEALQSLFPSCNVMGPRLSCEAFFWRQSDHEEDMFLCRGKRCYHPQILPDSSRTVTEFTLYDWLNHWGITYENASKPRSRDFPIRIAGYFNRLREIYRRLHCRACSTLMVPHMDYARTSYKWLSNGIVQVQQLAAAYRLTVFHCNDPDCVEHGNNYYINHCIGFNCREIIDSRDLKQKCGAGRYICNNCESCCQEHSNRAYQINGARPDTAAVANRQQSATFGRLQPNEAKPNVLLAPEIREFGRHLPGGTSSVPTLDDVLNFAWPDELDR
jgi:hypothetical protein